LAFFSETLYNENSFSFSLPSSRPSVVITDISYPSSATFLDDTVATTSEQAPLFFEVPSVNSATDKLVDIASDHSTPPPPPAICKTPPKGKRGKQAPSFEADLRF